jgi:2-dehydro-3-deoxygluconokinase
MAKIITFGEVMLRLAPHGYYRFIQTDDFEATYGGAEANVAVSLANYGEDAAFVTKLPENLIGQAAINSLRRFGVDVSKIVRGGERVGIYYMEKGASQRGSMVIYDRKYSSIQQAKHGDFDWKKIFKGAKWFHFTGITPALSPDVAALCLEACKAAKANKMTVSCDLNYRGKLWTKEQAKETMTKLLKYVDVVIANEDDCADVLNIKAANTDTTKGALSEKGYESVAKQVQEKFKLKMVAITLRTSISASDNKWAAMLYDGKKCYHSKEYLIHITDRVGGGDSFGAGLIYGLMHRMSAQATLEFAVAASCLKQTIEGDYNHATLDEVKKLAGGNASGRISR